MIEKKYIKPKKSISKADLTTLFDNSNTSNDKVEFGYAVFKPGARIPEEGYTSHEEDEYSFIIKGKSKIVIDEKEYEVSSSSAGFIPAGELHYSYNDSDEECELIWALVKK
ncbi:MAG TPA: cupin domain-containing protein [Anaerovoracaceae bacterium]|nr:cupin domain-containing protein [Anaerovoracaceae bacterium]